MTTQNETTLMLIDPISEQSPKPPKPSIPKPKASFRIPFWLRRFVKEHGILLSALVLLAGWTLITTGITKHNTAIEVTEAVTAERDAYWQQQLEALDQEWRTKTFIKDDESRQIANTHTAEALARAGYGVAGVCKSDDDFRTYYQTFVNRAHNEAYPSTVELCMSQKDQAMGYSEDNPIVERYYKLALEVVEANDEHWPCTEDFVFVDWSSGRMVARNEYNTGIHTNYWWWGK